MSGLELANTIADSSHASVPVVLLSASSVLSPETLDYSKANLAYRGEKPTSVAQLHAIMAEIWSQPEQDADSERSSERARPAKKLRSLNVLVAEDNVVNAQVLLGMLNKLGHLATLCENGQQAYDSYVSGRSSFDVILMDGEMPVMDGYQSSEMIRQFEQQQQKPRTPIVALTAHVLPEYQQKCHDVGMDYYLSKPITITQLNDTLAEISARKHTVSQATGV